MSDSSPYAWPGVTYLDLEKIMIDQCKRYSVSRSTLPFKSTYPFKLSFTLYLPFYTSPPRLTPVIHAHPIQPAVQKAMLGPDRSEYETRIAYALHHLQPWYHGSIGRAQATQHIYLSGHVDGKFLFVV